MYLFTDSKVALREAVTRKSARISPWELIAGGNGDHTQKELIARLTKAANAHFLFRSLCNQLLKRILNRFRISGIWLQAHFEIIEDRLLVGFRRGDFLELQVAHHDLVAPDRR